MTLHGQSHSEKEHALQGRLYLKHSVSKPERQKAVSGCQGLSGWWGWGDGQRAGGVPWGRGNVLALDCCMTLSTGEKSLSCILKIGEFYGM